MGPVEVIRHIALHDLLFRDHDLATLSRIATSNVSFISESSLCSGRGCG